MMRVFISYRRGDLDLVATLLRRALEAQGDSAIMDVHDIPLGANFVDHIRTELARCDVVIALIGPRWMPERLFEPGDFVRLEITTAWTMETPVIPVLHNTSIPSTERLPEAMQKLSVVNAAPLRPEPDLDTDLQRLLSARGIGQYRSPNDQPRSEASTTSKSFFPTPRQPGAQSRLSPIISAWASWSAIVLFVMGPFAMVATLRAEGHADTQIVLIADDLGLAPFFVFLDSVGITTWGYLAGLFGGLGAIMSMALRLRQILAQQDRQQLFITCLIVPLLMGLIAAVFCGVFKVLFGWTTLEHVSLVAAVSFSIGFGERLLSRLR